MADVIIKGFKLPESGYKSIDIHADGVAYDMSEDKIYQAEERKTGKWVIESDSTVMHCDVCGWAFEYYAGLEEEWNFCPNCGAAMGVEYE